MDRKIMINDLILEVTRRCNMNCAHCLRGPAEELDMPYKIIRAALKDVSHIGTLTFTGGEPSLYPKAMNQILQYCKEHHIDVDSFYLVTNGKHLNDAFLHSVLDWAIYTAPSSDGLTGISLSKDPFHESFSSRQWRNEQLLKQFSFYRNDHENDGKYLIKEGQAKTLRGNYEFRDPADYLLESLDESTDINWCDGEISPTGVLSMYDTRIYISAKGKVKIGCDDSYQNMSNLVGELSYQSLYDILKRLITECDAIGGNGTYSKVLAQLKESVPGVYVLPLENGGWVRASVLEGTKVKYEYIQPDLFIYDVETYQYNQIEKHLIAWYMFMFIDKFDENVVKEG